MNNSNANLETIIKKIFKDAGRSLAGHRDLCKRLFAIYKESDIDEFVDIFTHVLKFPLSYGERHSEVENMLSFATVFSTSSEHSTAELSESAEEENESDLFAIKILKFCLANHTACHQDVRFRVCEMVNKLLNGMGEQAAIDEDVYEEIFQTMLERLQDKSPAVRVQAVYALSRLQEPKNKDCHVIKAYLFHMCKDPSPGVRKAVLKNVAVTIHTLPSVINRIRDVQELVKKQAYLILSKKVHIRSYTIAQRVEIISEGLNDRSEAVRNCVKKELFPSWLRLLNTDMVELLKCLDVESSLKSAEQLLNCLFEQVPVWNVLENFCPLLGESTKIIPLKNLIPESAFYWNCLAKYLRKNGTDEHFELIVPDLSEFCAYIEAYLSDTSYLCDDEQENAIKMMEKNFVIQQLFSLAKFFDFSDEVGRKNLCVLIRNLLLDKNILEVEVLCDLLKILYKPAHRIDELAHIISELRSPIETVVEPPQKIIQTHVVNENDERKRKLKVAQLTVKINEIRDELETCVRSLDTLDVEKVQGLKTTLANLQEEKTQILAEKNESLNVVLDQNGVEEDEELGQEIKLKDDAETIARCLQIVCGVLCKVDIRNFCSTSRTILDTLILPSLTSKEVAVRRIAVKALAICCIKSKELAQQYLRLFIEVSRIDFDEIKIEAFRGLFDMWMMYGIDNQANYDHDESSAAETDANDTLAYLIDSTESENRDLKYLACEGLCKLFLTSRIRSSKLLSHLVICWYNPVTEEEHELRRMLGEFFTSYASKNLTNQELMGTALIPIVRALHKASIRSPLVDVDVDNVVSFIVSITNPVVLAVPDNNKTEKNKQSAHDSLVFSICGEILAHPRANSTRSFIKVLPNLTLSSNSSLLQRVKLLIAKIYMKINERTWINLLKKFEHNIDKMLDEIPPEEAMPDSETTSLDQHDVTKPEVSDVTNNSMNRKERRKRMLYNSQDDLTIISDTESVESESGLNGETRNEDREARTGGAGTQNQDLRTQNGGRRSRRVNSSGGKHLENKGDENFESDTSESAIMDERKKSPQPKTVNLSTYEIELTSRNKSENDVQIKLNSSAEIFETPPQHFKSNVKNDTISSDLFTDDEFESVNSRRTTGDTISISRASDARRKTTDATTSGRRDDATRKTGDAIDDNSRRHSTEMSITFNDKNVTKRRESKLSRRWREESKKKDSESKNKAQSEATEKFGNLILEESGNISVESTGNKNNSKENILDVEEDARSESSMKDLKKRDKSNNSFQDVVSSSVDFIKKQSRVQNSQSSKSSQDTISSTLDTSSEIFSSQSSRPELSSGSVTRKKDKKPKRKSLRVSLKRLSLGTRRSSDRNMRSSHSSDSPGTAQRGRPIKRSRIPTLRRSKTGSQSSPNAGTNSPRKKRFAPAK